MSESADDHQSEDRPSGQRPGPSDGNHSSGSQSSGNQSSGKQSQGRQAKPAGDPVADFQRWLMRAGARSMANQVADNVRRTLGQQKRNNKKSGDVWDTATTEPPPDEPPECQWCPVCQAARRLRESGPGLSAKIADAGGLLTALAQDAFSAVDQIMKTQNLSNERSGARPPAPAPSNGATPHPRSADPGGRPPGPPRSGADEESRQDPLGP
ncbi:MAG TPA: hypothetical protein VF070_11640 [Streptosporangiaceae bacterium]